MNAGNSNGVKCSLSVSSRHKKKILGMTATEKLNLVLKWLATSPFSKPFVTDGLIYSHLQKQHSELANQNDWGAELHRILDKLIKDGYVKSESRTVWDAAGNEKPNKQESYSITFEGEQFNKFGGYIENIKEMKSAIKLSDQELTILSDTLPFMKEFTEFVFFFVMENNTKWKDSNPAFSDRDHSSKIATRIYHFLIDYGFAVEMNGSYIETILLTDKGRSLKKAGSFETYGQELEEAEIKKIKRQKWTDRKAWWDAHGGIWISIIVVLIALSGFLGVKSCNNNPAPTNNQKAK